MGCDIHFYLEKLEDNGWVSSDKWTKHLDEEIGEEYKEVNFSDMVYRNRNYFLFSILADVRNYDNIEPICGPKGLPFNVSPEVLDAYTVKPTRDPSRIDLMRSWVDQGLSTWIEKDRICTNPDFHSVSYLTTREILSYNWFNTAEETFYIKLSTYVNFTDIYGGTDYREYCCRKHFFPTKGETVVTEEQVKQAVSKDIFDKDSVVQVKRDVPYSVWCQEFWTHAIPLMCSLGDLDSVRAVFWFDN